MLKKFTIINNFAITKLVNLKNHKPLKNYKNFGYHHYKDVLYIQECPKANLFDDVTNRIIKLCYIPASYSKHFRILKKKIK